MINYTSDNGYTTFIDIAVNEEPYTKLNLIYHTDKYYPEPIRKIFWDGNTLVINSFSNKWIGTFNHSN